MSEKSISASKPVTFSTVPLKVKSPGKMSWGVTNQPFWFPITGPSSGGTYHRIGQSATVAVRMGDASCPTEKVGSRPSRSASSPLVVRVFILVVLVRFECVALVICME
jgi:hypothetical protein